MTEIEPIRIFTKLDLMTSHLERLMRFESIPLTEYLGDFDKQLVVERLLHLIFQGAIDINRYLLKELGVDQARATNFEIFIEMGKCGIISPELSSRLANSGSLRNRLVHFYDEIDPVVVHGAIEMALQYDPIYQRKITNYIDSLEVDNA